MHWIKKTTKNGIPLFVYPMPHVHTVASGVLVNVGSRDENLPDEAGIAHGFEHLFFQGTRKFPTQKELGEYIEEVGGYKNAFTSKELTFFYNQMPYHEFGRGIEVLSEQIQYSLIPEEKVATEMKVVLQELKRAQDTPQRVAWDLLWETIFKGHPLSHSVLGMEETLKKFARRHFLDFMDRFYAPDNYVFIVAGKIDPELAQERFEGYFQQQLTGKKNKRQNLPQPTTARLPKAITRKKISQAHVYAGAPIFPANPKERSALELFSAMLGRGFASPLFEEIRNKRGLCYTVSSSYYRGTDNGVFQIYMATQPEKYEEAVNIALDLLYETSADAKRLEKSRGMVTGGFALSNENPYDIVSNNAYAVTFDGKPVDFEEYKKRLEEIAIKDVESVVEKYLKPENFTTALVLPEDYQD